MHNLVDLGAVSNIVNADIDSAAAIVDTKLAQITTLNKVSGSAIGNLASISAGAGTVNTFNLPVINTSMISYTSIPNAALLPLTLASWVDGSAMRNIQSMPSLAGQLSWYSISSSLASGGYPMFNGVDKFIGGVSSTPFTAGDYFVGGSFYIGVNAASTTPTKVLEVYIPRSGTLRIKFHLDGNAGTCNGRIYRNGSAIGTARSNAAGTGTNYSEDISGWSVGDLCQVYVWNSSAANDTYAGGILLYEGTPITVTSNAATYQPVIIYRGSVLPTTLLNDLGATGDLYTMGSSIYLKTGATTWTAL